MFPGVPGVHDVVVHGTDEGVFVGTASQLGLNQTPTVGNNGYWRTYLPIAH